MKIKTFDLSGFGGDYEQGLQLMLWTGVEFLQKNHIKELPSKQYQNIIGVADNQGEIGKAFDEAILAPVKEYGATGAMHQWATNHARFIALNGYKKWFEEGLKYGEPYEFDYPGFVDLDMDGEVG